MAELNLRIEVDVYKLDTEWMGQAKQFLQWAGKLAEARLAFDRNKSLLDVAKAELDQSIREDPASYGMAKITESAIQSTILLQPAYKQALENLNKGRYEMGVIQAAVDALEHRRKALENLVSLHGMQYFSEPKEPKGKKEEVTEVQKKKVRSKWLNSDD